jgi:hypothetical protein
MIKRLSILLLALVPTMLWAQFPPASCFAGTTAMHADSSAFVAWATGCAVERGPKRIDVPNSALASFGDETLALGKPGGTMDVVSLGDGGTATLTFDSPIFNGKGPDFAVFENGLHPDTDSTMTLYFLELAFVEVSSDGEHFFRFPAVTHVQSETQLENADAIDPSQIHNFAGKYEVMYGTPFDLDEVEDDALLNKDRITHVRLVDVVGCISIDSCARYDSQGHIVNDPWPTGFKSGGFDLDAVGVIHDLAHNDVTENEDDFVALYPNPVKDRLFVKAEGLQMVEVFNLMGQQVMVSEDDTIDLDSVGQGIYFVRVTAEGKVVTKRIVKQ